MENQGVQPSHHPHGGFFARFTVGAGFGSVWGGSLPPEPGFKPIPNLSNTGPVLGLTGQLGGGSKDVAIAMELLYERMLTGLTSPSHVNFDLFGVGVAASFFSDKDWFATAHLRWIMMLLWKSDIPCWYQRGDGTSGPGVGLTLGKEWHNENGNGLGVALQGNYATMIGEPRVQYVSGLLLFTMTRF